MNENLHQLHQEADESLVRNLSKRMSGLCRSACDLSQTVQGDAGIALVRAHEVQWKPDEGSDLGSNKADEASGHGQHARYSVAIKNIAESAGVKL